MRKLFKAAKEMEKKDKAKTESGKLLSEYVGMLRGLAIIHQTSHWLCRGDTYYEKHLLFERLYNSVSEDLDLAAEKLIGVFGVKFLDPQEHVEYAKKLVDEYNEKDFTERGLAAEVAFLTFSEELYEKIKESGDMSLGLDDMIMSIASNHEENIYLLKQQASK